MKVRTKMIWAAEQVSRPNGEIYYGLCGPIPWDGWKPHHSCHLQLEEALKSRSAYWRGQNHHMPLESQWDDLIGLFHLKLL